MNTLTYEAGRRVDKITKHQSPNPNDECQISRETGRKIRIAKRVRKETTMTLKMNCRSTEFGNLDSRRQPPLACGSVNTWDRLLFLFLNAFSFGLALLLAGIIELQAPELPLASAAEPRNKSERVSMTQLIATPERFSGKHVMVFGYFIERFEHSALYLTKDDATYGNSRNSLWIDLPDASQPKRPKQGFVSVRGYFSFHTNGCGHLGLWTGQITNVLEILKDRAF